jgi:hypothetical protein
MMIKTLLMFLVLTQMAWTQKDTSVQTDINGISAVPPDLPKVSETSSNADEEPGDESHDDHEDLGRNLMPRKSNKTKGHPKKSRKRDKSDGDLKKQKSGNGHKKKNNKKNKKKEKLSNQKRDNQKARNSKPRTKVKKQHLKKKMPYDSHGDVEPALGARAAAHPLPSAAPLSEHAAAPPPYMSNPTRHPDLSQNTKKTRSHDEEPTTYQPVIGARAAALPSPGADYSQNRNPSDKNYDTFYQDKLLQLQLLNEVQFSATPQHSPTPPYLSTPDNSYQRTDDSSHVGVYKAHHDSLGGAYNTHDSSNSEVSRVHL